MGVTYLDIGGLVQKSSVLNMTDNEPGKASFSSLLILNLTFPQRGRIIES